MADKGKHEMRRCSFSVKVSDTINNYDFIMDGTVVSNLNRDDEEPYSESESEPESKPESPE